MSAMVFFERKMYIIQLREHKKESKKIGRETFVQCLKIPKNKLVELAHNKQTFPYNFSMVEQENRMISYFTTKTIQMLFNPAKPLKREDKGHYTENCAIKK